MAQDLVAALGARLEARLRAQEARFKSVEETVRTQVLGQTPVIFSLPEPLQFTSDHTRTKGDDPALAPASSPANGFDIGATFRRKGVLSDVPMAVSRVENGLVFATFVDGEGAHEMSFDPEQLDLVDSAMSSAVQATVSAHVTANVIAPAAPGAPWEAAAAAIDPVVVSTSTPPADVTTAPFAASVPPSIPALNENTVAASIARAMAPAVSTVAESIARAMAPAVSNNPAATSANATAATAAQAANAAAVLANTSVVANAPAIVASVASTSANTTASITLADGTLQFQYAPTGGNGIANPPAAFTPPVPASFGEGATFRRKGVGADIPMTVTRVGNGVVFANYTDSEGTREMAFTPNQLDLVNAAP